MSVLNNYEEISIGGEKYTLCLRNRCILAAEAELLNQNLINTVSDMPMSAADTFTLFKWAIIGGGKNFASDDAAFELYMAAVDEHGSVGVFSAVFKALQKSGVLGNGKKKAPAKQDKE